MGKIKTIALVVAASAFSAVPGRADESKVRQFISAYMDAFNRQDLDAVAGMWSETASYCDRETGEVTQGRAAIRAELEQTFSAEAKSHLSGDADRIRFVKPDVVSVQGTTTLSIPDEDPKLSHFSAILVKHEDGWMIDCIEETSVTAPESARDALQALEWLVGEWVDESGEATIRSRVRWSDGEAFLVRTIVEHSGDEVSRVGTQVIGWDPRSRHIRSWSFNADGSFGDGVWSKNGDDWLIKSTQTLSDGQAAAGTYVLTVVDDNTLTWSLIGHAIEGRPIPASPPVTVVRAAETAQSEEAEQNTDK